MEEIKDYRKISKESWGSDQPVTIQMLNTGALLRIADATDVMAENYRNLIEQRDSLKEDYKRHVKFIHEQESSIYHLRGWITRLKKEISQLKNK